MKYEIFAIIEGREQRIGQTATLKSAKDLQKRTQQTYDKVRIAKINEGIKNAHRYE